MTFSLIARSPASGQFGMVIASSSPAVAARCVHLRAGVGAVASQNITDPGLGAALLTQMARGQSAAQALDFIVSSTPHIAYRQLMVIDAAGQTAQQSGAQCLGVWAEARGDECAASGNLLANTDVPAAMVAAFTAAAGDFGTRLMAALCAGLAAGGEAGPVQSAGLQIVDTMDWPLVDLRVDWSDSPIADLHSLWQRYRPQMAAYVQRASDPTAAPSYGVPGDL